VKKRQVKVQDESKQRKWHSHAKNWTWPCKVFYKSKQVNVWKKATQKSNMRPATKS
jgi:hypothetical protein